MTSSLAAIMVPIVVAIALVIWIVAVMHANKRPGHRRGGQLPRREVIGGAFRASGGRQLMPLPGAEPADIRPASDQRGEADRADSE